MSNQGAVDTFEFNQLTLIVPVLNEADNIGHLLEELAEQYPGIRVLVVDDMSTDNTVSIVSEKSTSLQTASIAALVRDDAQYRGITASVLDGLACVETPYFGVMDGDRQHPIDVIMQMLSYLLQGTVLVVGVRKPYKENQGLHRIVMTRLATKLARFWLAARGVSVRDPMSGYFLGHTEAIRNLIAEHPNSMEPEGYKVLFDILRVINPTLPIAQVEYQFGVREGGHSKLRPAHAYYFLRSFFRRG